MRNTGASFFTSYVEPDLNDEPHIYRGSDGGDYATVEGYTCQCVGGGTQHYGGVSLRFSQLDFGLTGLEGLVLRANVVIIPSNNSCFPRQLEGE